MNCPRIEINLEKIKENASLIKQKCEKRGIEVVGVTKGFCAYPPIAMAFYEGGIRKFGDSRIINLKRLEESGVEGEKYLIRIPMQSEAEEVVRWADVSLNSEVDVINALGKEAVKQDKSHDVILMVDVGDLREGVLPDRILPTVEQILNINGVNLKGLGSNVGCYGGVLPSYENTKILVDLAREIKNTFGVKMELLSGGSTVSLGLVEKQQLAEGINQFRIGEAILLGYDSTGNKPIKGAHQDTMRLVAEIIELKDKPSVPSGEIGRDAFGNVPEFEDKGIRKRAILALGRQDVPLEKLVPLDSRLEILGGSSDHLIIDCSDADRNYCIGSEVAFKVNYSVMLAAMTSEYVEKVYV